jgi:hypothetical protein
MARWKQIVLGVAIGVLSMGAVANALEPNERVSASALPTAKQIKPPRVSHHASRATTTSSTDSSDDEGDEEDSPSSTGSGETSLKPNRSTAVPSTATVGHTTSGCRTGDPLTNVYHPYRLSVIDPCKSVSGWVRIVRREDDSDVHFDLQLDSQYADLINDGNRTYQHGYLVVEIVPADEPGCTVGEAPRSASGTYDYGICTGANVATPAVGSHVWVTGPYVVDHAHNWMEIHPVWSIRSFDQPAAAPAPSNTATSPAPTNATTARIVSVTSPVKRGSTASLVAQTDAGAACNLAVTLPSGSQSASSGLGTANADGSGRVSWSWRTGSNTTPGTAHAKVSCGSANASADFEITS